MKTIGVLGLGAHATVDFEMHVHRAAERVILPRTPVAYPPMIVHYHRRAPVVVGADFAAVMPLRVAPELLETARWLGAKADLLVMTSNGAHLFKAEIERAAGKPMLSMIEATIAEVRRRKWKRVGALAFQDHRARVYAEPLRAAGVECETIDEAMQARLNAAVFRMMEGCAAEDSRGAAREAVAMLRAKGVDGVIPGCTEIPLLLGVEAEATDLVNPAQLLAEVTVEMARG